MMLVFLKVLIDCAELIFDEMTRVNCWRFQSLGQHVASIAALPFRSINLLIVLTSHRKAIFPHKKLLNSKTGVSYNAR